MTELNIQQPDLAEGVYFSDRVEVLRVGNMPITIDKNVYGSPQGAKIIWDRLGTYEKEQMARTYQQGFAGAPWFEVGKCGNCGRFTSSMDNCDSCSATGGISEAYPLTELVEETLPNTIARFSPGTLVTAEDVEGGIIGFATGGITEVGALIRDKYKLESSESILEELRERIAKETGVSIGEEFRVAYENEAVVRPDYQQTGMGGKLNSARLEVFREMNAGIIVGRTVNVNWLRVKARQLSEAGYRLSTFAPEGDSYEVDGQKRLLFFAVKED